MLIKFILVVIGLYIIISNPFLIVIAGVAYLTWLFLKKPNCFTRLPAHLTMPPGEDDNEPEVNLSRWKREDCDQEEKADQAAEAKMKPGYKDDAKWQELTKKIGKHVAENQKKEEQAERLQKLTDEVI